MSNSLSNQHKTDEDSRDLWGHFHRLIKKKNCMRYALANRLRVRLEGLGNPLYDYKWKVWDMLQSPPIFALRASGRHIPATSLLGINSAWKNGYTKSERGRTGSRWKVLGGSSETSQLGYTDLERLERRRLQPTKQQSQISAWQTSSVVLCADGKGRRD